MSSEFYKINVWRIGFEFSPLTKTDVGFQEIVCGVHMAMNETKQNNILIDWIERFVSLSCSWGHVLWPLSGIVIRKKKFSKLYLFASPGDRKEASTLLGTLERPKPQSLGHWTQHIASHFSPEDGNGSGCRNFVFFSIYNSWRWT